jgi:hypothetical protein
LRCRCNASWLAASEVRQVGWYRPWRLVSDSTLETPQILSTEDQGSSRAAKPRGAGSYLRRYVWYLVGLGILVASAVLILVLRTRPGYDPYGWLDWGYQTLRGTLNLGGAPSWKPFTYLFTVPYSIFGHYALWIWMETAVAVSLAGAVFGGRIAYKLTAREAQQDTPARRRYAPIAAAVFAGAAVLGIQQYFHYVFSVQSDPMLVTCCLAAIDFYLDRHYAWAWWMAALASLGRPEVWPFAGLYAIWVFVKLPRMRWMLYTGVIVNAFLWFGVPTITNGRPDIAGQLALKSPRELHQNKIVGTWDRFMSLQVLPIWLAAITAAVLAALRRNLVVLTLAALCLGWMVVEIAFALHGFPAVYRYMFEPAGLAGVLGGVAVGWLLLDASKIHRALPSWAGIVVVAILVAFLIPDAINAGRVEHRDLFHERARTTQINRLAATLNALGGYRHVLACGHPVVNVEYVSIMAWFTHLNTGAIGYRPVHELRQEKYPIVLFTPLPNGWAIKPYRTLPSMRSACSNLTAFYVPTARHPNGVLVPK